MTLREKVESWTNTGFITSLSYMTWVDYSHLSITDIMKYVQERIVSSLDSDNEVKFTKGFKG
jgi:hypothetical protein